MCSVGDRCCHRNRRLRWREHTHGTAEVASAARPLASLDLGVAHEATARASLAVEALPEATVAFPEARIEATHASVACPHASRCLTEGSGNPPHASGGSTQPPGTSTHASVELTLPSGNATRDSVDTSSAASGGPPAAIGVRSVPSCDFLDLQMACRAERLHETSRLTCFRIARMPSLALPWNRRGDRVSGSHSEQLQMRDCIVLRRHAHRVR